MAATITYKGTGEAYYMRRDVLAPEIFGVTGDGYDLHVLASASGMLAEILRREGLTPGDVVRQVGLVELERRLATGELPHETDEGYIEILYSSDSFRDLLDGLSATKECGWQIPGTRELESDATPTSQDRSTTEALCRACSLPDERVICTHLRHPTNLPVRTSGASTARGFDAAVTSLGIAYPPDDWTRRGERCLAAFEIACTRFAFAFARG
jgi:hypothetical protein